MMATTHALMGALVGTLVFLVAPDQGSNVVLAGLVGGVLPDLDIYAGHRKTLHFPVYYAVAAVAVALLALVTAAPLAVLATVALAAAAVHSVMDVFGGGLELRPWEGRSERAVFNHATGRWHRPRRWVRYDGAPEDALLGLAVAVPTFLFTDGPLRLVVAGAVSVSVGWVLVRKHVPVVTERVVALLPSHVRTYVPERFRERTT